MAEKKSKKQHIANNSGMGSAYFVAMIGAAIYWIGQATGFGEILVALLKALVWPAFLVYDLLRFISG